MAGKIKKLLKGGLGFIKGSAEQIGETISPGSLIEHALGQKKRAEREDEFTKYLQTLGPDVSKEELEKKKKEFSESEKGELNKARSVIRSAIPAHMRPPPQPAKLRPYEEKLREEEEKKAKFAEEKKNQSPMMIPTGSNKKPGLGKKKQKPSNMEAKDIKKVW